MARLVVTIEHDEIDAVEHEFGDGSCCGDIVRLMFKMARTGDYKGVKGFTVDYGGNADEPVKTTIRMEQ